MRALNVFSGIAVLFTTAGFAHLIFHFAIHLHPGEIHLAAFWLGISFAVILAIFSFVGAFLLIRSSR